MDFLLKKVDEQKVFMYTFKFCFVLLLLNLRVIISFSDNFSLAYYRSIILLRTASKYGKDRGNRDQSANICWIMEKAKQFQKNIYFCFIDYSNAFDCVDHNKLWKILKEMGIPGHLTCLLRNLYTGQEATVRTGHGTTDWLQIR